MIILTTRIGCTGSITLGLGLPLLMTLHEGPWLPRQKPELVTMIGESLQEPQQKGPLSYKMDLNRTASSFSLLEFTSDGLSKRTPVSLQWALKLCNVSANRMISK